MEHKWWPNSVAQQNVLGLAIVKFFSLHEYIYMSQIYTHTQLDVERGLNIVSISFVGDTTSDDYVIGNTNEAQTEKHCCVESLILSCNVL